MSSNILMHGGSSCVPKPRLSSGDAAVVVIIVIVAAVMTRDGMPLSELLLLLASVGVVAVLVVRLNTGEFKALRRVGKVLVAPAQT
ncbi:hypothetical protein ACGF0K_36140 [Streptomyces sp. NPDC048156]|uniref:hypothetical protein n=1 Tax=Streptomyces sp. NPDC048156 TaxID=3365502 RepID=UPI0037146C4A